MHFCTSVLQKKLSEIAILAALAVPFVSAFNQIAHTKFNAACREKSFENHFDGVSGSLSVTTAFQAKKSKLLFALPNDSEEVDATLKEALSAIQAAEEALRVAKDNAASVNKQTISKQTQVDAIAAATAGAALGAITGATMDVALSQDLSLDFDQYGVPPALLASVFGAATYLGALDENSSLGSVLRGTLGGASKGIFGLLKGKIESDVDDVKRIPERLKESATKAAIDVKEAATKKVEETTARIKEAPKLVAEGAKAAVARATTEVKEVVTKRVQKAKDAVVEALDVVTSFLDRTIQEVERLVSGPPSDPLLLLNPEPAEIPPSPELPSALEPKSSIELPKLSLPKIQLPEHTIPSLSLSEIARVPERTNNGKPPSEKSSEAAVAISKAPSPKQEKNEPNIIFNDLSLQKLTGEIIEHTEKKPIQSVLEIFQKAAEGRRLELRKKNIVGKQAFELRSKSGADLLPLEKRQKPLYAENIDRAKAERQRKLEGGERREAARMKLPKGVAVMKSWRKNRNGTFSLAAEAKARAAAAAKAQKEQEAASERQRAQDATRKKVAANFFGNGDKEVDTANNDIVAGPPKGVPVLSMWRRNSNGSISGIISGHPAHVDGDTISTSPLKGEAISGSVVTTQSGSRYFLKEKASFPLFGLPSSGSKSGAELLSLVKRQKPLYAENIHRAKAERQRKLEGGERREAARIKLPKGVAVMKSWRKNRNGTFSLAAEAKARAAAAAKAQKEQEDARERQRAQDAMRKKAQAIFFGSGVEAVALANDHIATGPPKGVPVLSKWTRNSDGSISGIIFGHPAHVDGDTISTSPLKGEAISGSVVTTQSGSRYFLNEKAGFSLFGSPSSGLE